MPRIDARLLKQGAATNDVCTSHCTVTMHSALNIQVPNTKQLSHILLVKSQLIAMICFQPVLIDDSY